jgi:hypothetical protein
MKFPLAQSNQCLNHVIMCHKNRETNNKKETIHKLKGKNLF